MTDRLSNTELKRVNQTTNFASYYYDLFYMVNDLQWTSETEKTDWLFGVDK